MKPEDLNESDWDEIYYALERKAVEIEHGKLDDGGEPFWIGDGTMGRQPSRDHGQNRFRIKI